MARDQKKHQQKLMKERRKKKAKMKHAIRLAAASTGKAIIRRANQFPIHECLIGGEWRENGLAPIVVARRQSDGMLTVGVFLVDLYCLGVKYAYSKASMPMSHYREMFRPNYMEKYRARPCSPERARQIIYGAIDYAAGLGFKPHKNFKTSRHLLDDRETIPLNDTLEFGKDGKPLYVSGPHDPVGRILKHLESRLGKDGFHYICETSLLEDDDTNGREYFR